MNISIKSNVKIVLENLANNIKNSHKVASKIMLRRLKNRVKSFSNTGRMLNSIDLIVKAKTSEIIIDVPYASIQDEGGKIPITPEMRKKMWALYSSTGNELYKRIAITKQDYIIIKGKHYIEDRDDIKVIEKQLLKHLIG